MRASDREVEFLKHVIAVKEQSLRQVQETIANLKDFVPLRLAGSEHRTPVAFTDESLQAILATAPDSLHLEGFAPAMFKKCVVANIDQAVATALSLRGILCRTHVAELAPQMRDFISELEPLVRLLECHARRSGQSGVAENAQRLNDALLQFAASSFEREDNVLCMDDLQYQILPVLKKLQRVLGK